MRVVRQKVLLWERKAKLGCSFSDDAQLASLLGTGSRGHALEGENSIIELSV